MSFLFADDLGRVATFEELYGFGAADRGSTEKPGRNADKTVKQTGQKQAEEKFCSQIREIYEKSTPEEWTAFLLKPGTDKGKIVEGCGLNVASAGDPMDNIMQKYGGVVAIVGIGVVGLILFSFLK
jgi:hypothetical protein